MAYGQWRYALLKKVTDVGDALARSFAAAQLPSTVVYEPKTPVILKVAETPSSSGSKILGLSGAQPATCDNLWESCCAQCCKRAFCAQCSQNMSTARSGASFSEPLDHVIGVRIPASQPAQPQSTPILT